MKHSTQKITTQPWTLVRLPAVVQLSDQSDLGFCRFIPAVNHMVTAA